MTRPRLGFRDTRIPSRPAQTILKTTLQETRNERPCPISAILLFVVPALASEAQPDAPPSPPSVTYEVWGFKWDGQRYEKQANYSFTTTDIKKAAIYADQVNGYAGWSATTNIPEPCVVHTVFHGPAITDDTAICISRQTDLRGLGLHAGRTGNGSRTRSILGRPPDPLLRLGVREESQRRSRLAGHRQLPRAGAGRRNDMSMAARFMAPNTTPTTPAPERSRLAGGPFICHARRPFRAPEFKRECPIRHLRQLTKLRHLEQRPRHDQHAKYDQHSKYD